MIFQGYPGHPTQEGICDPRDAAGPLQEDASSLQVGNTRVAAPVGNEAGSDPRGPTFFVVTSTPWRTATVPTRRHPCERWRLSRAPACSGRAQWRRASSAARDSPRRAPGYRRGRTGIRHCHFFPTGILHRKRVRQGGIMAEGPRPSRADAGPWAAAGPGLSVRARATTTQARRGRRVISDCHPSEGTSNNRTQIPITHMFYLFSALSTLG